MTNEDNTRKEQMEGAWEAMSRIIVQQEDGRQLDTIRVRVIEKSNWRQGLLRAMPELPGPRVRVGSGLGFGWMWLQRAGHCANSSFVSGI